VTESVLKAIQNGQWDFEPDPISEDKFRSTKALPGSSDKVQEMAARVKMGLPLWHSKDRRFYDDTEA
jgi:hypothetical protein